MIEWVLIFVLLVVILILFSKYSKIKGQIEQKAREIFDSWHQKESEKIDKWKKTELERLSNEKAKIQFETWRLNEEKNIRNDAIKRSQSVTRGRVTECLIPFFPDFPYNPKDARFLGTPVDFIVFNGLSDEENITEVAFIEIKTGKAANLNKRERAVRDCIKEGRVNYYTIHQSFNDTDNQPLNMKIK